MSSIRRAMAIALVLWFLPGAGQAGEVTAAVASNFQNPFAALSLEFQKQTGHTVRRVTGSTGKLYAQIVHRAPFDVFLAADAVRPRKLAEAGLAVESTRFTYALGRLALWSADPAFVPADGARALREGAIRHLALANPHTAPYGQAARQVLRALGVEDRLRDRLVFGENIGQAFQFVATGNAEAGLVALSQVLDPRLRIRGSHWTVPETLYSELAQDAVLLRRGQSNPAASAFMEFLKSAAARDIILGYGYGLK